MSFSGVCGVFIPWTLNVKSDLGAHGWTQLAMAATYRVGDRGKDLRFRRGVSKASMHAERGLSSLKPESSRVERHRSATRI